LLGNKRTVPKRCNAQLFDNELNTKKTIIMINNIGKKGIVTQPTLFMMNNPDLESVLKRYAIFFDEFYYFDNPLEGFISHGSKNELKTMLININKDKDEGSDKDFILSSKFNEIIKDDDDVSEFFKTKRTDYRRNSFIQEQQQIAFSRYVKEIFPKEEQNSKYTQNMIGFYGHHLLADFDLYSNLSENPEYSGLISPLLKGMINSVFNSNKNTGEELIKEVSEIKLIDFGVLSWNQIYELRENDFAGDFRVKIKEWLIEFADEGDASIINSKIKKYIIDADANFYKMYTPNSKLTTIKAILGNTPFPLPVNPVSVISGIDDVRKDIKNKNEFGWMHFVMNMYRESDKKKS